MSAIITTRRIDPVTWEPQYGNGQSDFISDIDAVGQIIAQRLKLFQGEWWSDLQDGLPLWQKILGVGGVNSAQINLLIQARIQGTPYVTGISRVESSYNSSSRAYSFSAVVQTQFGQVVITNSPITSLPSRALPQ